MPKDLRENERRIERRIKNISTHMTPIVWSVSKTHIEQIWIVLLIECANLHSLLSQPQRTRKKCSIQKMAFVVFFPALRFVCVVCFYALGVVPYLFFFFDPNPDRVVLFELRLFEMVVFVRTMHRYFVPETYIRFISLCDSIDFALCFRIELHRFLWKVNLFVIYCNPCTLFHEYRIEYLRVQFCMNLLMIISRCKWLYSNW